MTQKNSKVKSNSLESTTLAEAIKAVEALKRIREWAEENKGYLSRRTEYARGYANGIFQAQLSILDLIDEIEESAE